VLPPIHPARAPLVDTHGRTVRDLRISVTDRCNLRCVYCMPAEGMPWLQRSDLLTYEELTRLARVCLECGVTGIRLTGGEPTVRADLPVLVRMLHGLAPGLDLSLTTNGIKLPELAGELRDAGLKRVNVSLDTLSRERFHRLARRDRLAEVLAGLEAARRAGFAPIKVNAVLVRGFNDDEAVPLARWAREEGFELRFIEWMPLDFGHEWANAKLVTADEILAQVAAEFPLELEPGADPSAPATLYRYRDGGGRLGVVASVTRPFCGRCDRIRLTADGQIRTCLFALSEYDLRGLLRSGADDDALERRLREAVLRKQPGHLINRPGFVQPKRGMSAIGG
jgi:cyclic pyranopterin phosphate synthase